MAGLTKIVKDGVEKFTPLYDKEKYSEDADAFKKLIADDESKPSDEDVEKIFNKIVSAESEDENETAKPVAKKAKKKYIVASPFEDAPEYSKGEAPKKYEIGDDVSDFDSARLSKLVERKLVSEA